MNENKLQLFGERIKLIHLPSNTQSFAAPELQTRKIVINNHNSDSAKTKDVKVSQGEVNATAVPSPPPGGGVRQCYRGVKVYNLSASVTATQNQRVLAIQRAEGIADLRRLQQRQQPHFLHEQKRGACVDSYDNHRRRMASIPSRKINDLDKYCNRIYEQHWGQVHQL